MANHARIEELSDSDPEEIDISQLDPTHPSHATSQSSSLLSQANAPRPSGPIANSAQSREKIKNWQCLYPIYFDKTRSRHEGRRVGAELGVENPLARDLCDAVAALGLEIVFEPEKIHPQDWANPGRVRVNLKEGPAARVKVENKHHLYIRVAEYLRAHPTTKDSPMRLQIQGMKQDKPPEPPAVPRGWKMGTVLPFHSAAVSGGGVSENLFKDMMSQMGGMGGLPGMMGGGGGPSSAVPQVEAKKKGKK